MAHQGRVPIQGLEELIGNFRVAHGLPLLPALPEPGAGRLVSALSLPLDAFLPFTTLIAPFHVPSNALPGLPGGEAGAHAGPERRGPEMDGLHLQLQLAGSQQVPGLERGAWEQQPEELLCLLRNPSAAVSSSTQQALAMFVPSTADASMAMPPGMCGAPARSDQASVLSQSSVWIRDNRNVHII